MSLGNGAPPEEPGGSGAAVAGARALETNAPPYWPSVPIPPGSDAGAPQQPPLRSLVRAVTDALTKGGLRVRARNSTVDISQQSVKIDLVVDDGRGERPVFVFPGRDPGREGAMFQFLYALLREAEAFPAAPVYFSPNPFPYIPGPGETVPAILNAAEAFEKRAAAAGLDAGHDLSPKDLVTLLRQLAAAPAEAGGADPVVEAAAFTGTWLLQQVEGNWDLREDLPRTVLILQGAHGSVYYELPLFALFPDAVRTGYDGLEQLFTGILADLQQPLRVLRPEQLTFYPEHLSACIQGWLTELYLTGATVEQSAILTRRCASCGELVTMEAIPQVPADDANGALQAALVLAAPEAPPCPYCSSALHSGTLAAYLMAGEDGNGLLVSAYVSSTFLRVSFHAIDPEGNAMPVALTG